MVLGDLWRYARQTPHRAAIREWTGTQWSTTTYAQLLDAAMSVSAHAARFDQAPVAVVLDNSARSAAVLLGFLSAATPVVLLEAAGSQLSDHRSVVHTIGLGGVVRPDATAPGELGYGDLLTGTAHTLADRTDGPVLQLTSGSTGEPRLARLTAADLLRGARLYRDIHQYTSADRVLLPLPFAHSFGLVGGLIAALTAGAELLTVPKFDLRAIWDGLAGGVGILLGTPMIYEMMSASAASATRPPALRVALSSGGPMDPQVHESATARLGRPVLQVYGSTETGLIACQYHRPEGWPAGSAGAVAPGVECRLDDGRLMVRTTTMFSGYLTAAGLRPLTGDFYDTGDMAAIDAAGTLFLLARKDTFVNVGGRKVNPARIARIVAEHPAVGEVHVFGHRAGSGESVHAAVVLAGPAGPDDPGGRITGFLRTRLAAYEVPFLHFVERLPRTSLGKVHLPSLLERTGLSRS
jgi:acyl-CoA synthetase (AMP-forming)/AMP-acid ligase II